MMTAVTNSPNGAGRRRGQGPLVHRRHAVPPVQGAPRRQGGGEGRRAPADAGRLPAGGVRWARAEWAVASLWRIGNGFAHIADVVEATPVPAGAQARRGRAVPRRGEAAGRPAQAAGRGRLRDLRQPRRVARGLQRRRRRLPQEGRRSGQARSRAPAPERAGQRRGAAEEGRDDPGRRRTSRPWAWPTWAPTRSTTPSSTSTARWRSTTPGLSATPRWATPSLLNQDAAGRPRRVRARARGRPHLRQGPRQPRRAALPLPRRRGRQRELSVLKDTSALGPGRRPGVEGVQMRPT